MQPETETKVLSYPDSEPCSLLSPPQSYTDSEHGFSIIFPSFLKTQKDPEPGVKAFTNLAWEKLNTGRGQPPDQGMSIYISISPPALFPDNRGFSAIERNITKSGHLIEITNWEDAFGTQETSALVRLSSGHLLRIDIPIYEHDPNTRAICELIKWEILDSIEFS